MPVLVPAAFGASLLVRMSSPGPSGPHGRKPSLLEKARDADPARGADGDLPLLLAAGPVREALLRLVGTGGLGALMATRRALQRDVRELAAQVAWDESIDFDFELVVHPSRIAMWAKSFPNSRALNVMHRMAEALAVQFATTAGGLRNLQSLTPIGTAPTPQAAHAQYGIVGSPARSA